MVGRPNVGKSSLINALVKQKIARTSAAPGKTRLVNYYLIESPTPNPQSLYLVDFQAMATRAAAASRSTHSSSSRRCTSIRPRARSAVLAGFSSSSIRGIPSTAGPRPAMPGCSQCRRLVAIVATKIDKLNRADRRKTMRELKEDAVTTPQRAGRFGVPRSFLDSNHILKTIRGRTAR